MKLQLLPTVLMAILMNGCGPTPDCLLEAGDTYVDCEYPATEPTREQVARARECILGSVAEGASFRSHGRSGPQSPGLYREVYGVRRDGTLLVYIRADSWIGPCPALSLLMHLGDGGNMEVSCSNATMAQSTMQTSPPNYVTSVDHVPLTPAPAEYARRPPTCAAR